MPAGTATDRVSVLSRSSPAPLYHWLAPSNGAPRSDVIVFFGSTTIAACGLAELYSCGPRSRILDWPATTTS